MSIEPIGLLTIIAGLLGLLLGYRAAFATLVVATLFGAAAAVLIGPANIQPAHLLLAFVAATVFTRNHERAGAIDSIRFPKPGFWLMCLVLYGVVSAILIPRFLAGDAQIIPLGASEYAATGSTVPLGPVSSNFTQSVYMIADLICFTIAVAVASTQAGFAAITGALLAYAAGNVLFALVDVVTYSSGTQWLLEFMRNAQYTLHNEEEVSGLKRIVGSFPEASAFARTTLGALGFTGTLWLCGRRPALTGVLAIASLVLVVLSTSSTGLAGTGPVLLILYATALLRSGFHPNRPYRSAAVLCAPLAVIAVVLAVLLNDAASETVRNYIDLLIFNKAGSDSGVARDAWNVYALQNFFDSYGLGVGLGTVRTSSLPFALVSNVGIPGSLFYLLFIGTAFLHGRGTPRTFPSDVRLAARNACLGLIIGDALAAPTVEQGLLFYVLAAMACAEPERTAEEPFAESSPLTGARA
ncbi:hypothetical protein SAMN05444158_7245 [Bradyrhizobium canariense]|uniref:Uncharacterized protein n=2 Tax=Bradyrhizobium canariense TaxID=255045 RepID=A0A1H2BJA2_9BRAD|nr:hypothetical protein SAMN05444158_7245 [Bradyrhizobium canariense]